MSEPAWRAECRLARRVEKLTYAELMIRFDRSYGSIERALHSRYAKPKRTAMAEAKRKLWADPEWAKRQRALIAAGIERSPRAPGRPRECDRPICEPWKPGTLKPQWLTRGRS